ncbi:MAG: glutamate synthase-related protein, partial [Cyclobacteriaceae bacterium]
MTLTPICSLKALHDRKPFHAQVDNLDLVVIKYDNDVSVLYGRCLHRGALLSDGYIEGENLICGLHNWDYRYDTGISAYNNEERLYKFKSYIKDGEVFVDLTEINNYLQKFPQPFDRKAYLGDFADTHPEDTEPYTSYIQSLSKNGLKKYGSHGPSEAMGVGRNSLPKWEQIQFLPAQLSKRPLLDDADVNSTTVIGPKAKKPMKLSMPVFVSDMSFGALSREAKIALSKGAELAGTGICSGEGGMLPDEQEANSNYLYELASGKFGFSWEKVKKAQAFHFKGGQGAKTGTGGHLPGNKVTKEIAE